MLDNALDSQVCLASMAEFPSLGGVYVVSLIVAGGFLVVSTFLGGDSDVDVDVDIDADFDLEVDVEGDVDVDSVTDAAEGALALSTWISVRFLIYFAAMFGMVGTILTLTSEMGPGRVLAYAVMGGFVVGQIAHQVFRYLKKTSSDSSTHVKDYVNKIGRVTVAIKPRARGEVAIQIGDNERYVPAKAKRSNEAFESGQSVGVIDYRAGTALVVSRKEYDFLNESNEGGTT